MQSDKTPVELTPCQRHARNLDTIIAAARNGRLALLEVREVATNAVRAALVAINCDDGAYSFVPFALMIDGNPYELLQPPNPDGGFTAKDS